jgi:hypothetical protein
VVTHELTDAPPASNGDSARALPASIAIGSAPAFSPNELRVLKAQTGRTLESIMNDEADAMQATIWFALRRAGYDPTFEAAGEVRGEMATLEPDPTIGAASTTSPHSADSGV